MSSDLHVPANRIYGIVHGTRVITPETALRPARYFGVTPETWIDLQSDYDLRIARRRAGEEIAKNREETRSRNHFFGLLLSPNPVELIRPL